MKLRRLSIHNLASIADATIDFDKAPLSGASVFLISGEIGSGKSTILDAICLALYNTVPRMEAASVGRNDSQAADNESRTAHVFQLLRKGTAHTLITLRFTGLYDKEYEAHWGIRRARNKPEGKLQENQMDLSLAELTLDADGNEIAREEIKRSRTTCAKTTESIIGLSYGQFCRTTMLAQGEFSRFIKSDGAEKSSILAKVTERSDFYEIGRTIHEITSEKKRELDDLRRDMAGVKILSEQESDALKSEIREADSQLARLDAEGAAAARKLEWLGKAADLSGRTEKNTGLVNELQARVDNKIFTDRELRSRQWFETELVRRDRMCLRTARADISKADKALLTLSERYSMVLGARENVAAKLDTACKKEKELKDRIVTYSPKRTLLTQEPVVVRLLSLIISRQNDIKDADRRNSLRDAEIRKATSVCETESLKADSLKIIYEKAAAATEQVRGKLAALDLPGVTKQISALAERRTSMASFVAELERYCLDVGNADQLEKEINSERDRLIADTKSCDDLAKSLDDAARRMEERRIAYETAQLTVADFTQRLRESLTVGCECPVCRQTISRKITFDMTEGLAYVGRLRQEARQAREDHDALAKEIAEARGVLKKTLREIERKEKRLVEARTELDARLETISQRASALTPAPGAGEPSEWTESAKDEILKIDATLAELHKKSEDAKTIGRELDRSGTEEKKAFDKWQAQEKQKSDAANALAAIKTARQTDTETSRRCADEIKKTHSMLTRMIDNAVWEYDSPDNAATFEKSFADDCKTVRELDSRLDAQSRSAQQLRDCLNELDAECVRVCRTYPEFAAASPSSSDKDASAALAYARQVAADVAVTVTDRSRLIDREKELSSAVTEFNDTHPGYDDATFDTLDMLTRTEAEQMRDDCRDVRTQLKSALQIKEQLDSERKALADTGSDIGNEDTAERLLAEAGRIKEEQAEANRKKGAALQQLANDTENRAKSAEMNKQLDRLQTDFDRWSAFNDRLGSATGDKFNRIAQSYVLADLLDRANVYLSQLIDRYRLVGHPGSYDINIIDRLQGDAVRSVHSTSGGEGFLVSLSLALALGDIGSRLTVDPLFIDEGFGTLSGGPLLHAIDLLNSLRRQLGRRVGVISHIPSLRESIPVQLHLLKDPRTAFSTITIEQL